MAIERLIYNRQRRHILHSICLFVVVAGIVEPEVRCCSIRAPIWHTMTSAHHMNLKLHSLQPTAAAVSLRNQQSVLPPSNTSCLMLCVKYLDTNNVFALKTVHA